MKEEKAAIPFVEFADFYLQVIWKQPRRSHPHKSMKIVIAISRISAGIPRRKPISHATPADFPKLRVQPIHGVCLGTNVLESLRLK